jgi:ATP-dependent Zn protease
VEGRYLHTKTLLLEKRPLLEKVAANLLEKESLDEKEFKTLLE